MSESVNGLAFRPLRQQKSPSGRRRICAPRMRFACVLFCLVAQSSVSPQAAWAGTSDELRIALQELEQMRWDGKFPPYDEAERRTAELLEEYVDPRDQGRIWFQLVQIYGQTAGPPQRVIDCAKKALQFPHEPPQRIRLYLYWSDSLLRLDPDGPLSERRRAAATVSLDALVELRKYNLPDSVSELPDATPSGSEQGSEEDREKNRKRLRVVKELHQHHENIFKQIVEMYTLRPFATEELRELATEKVNDPELVDRLLRGVEPKIEKSIAKYGPVVPPSESMPDPPPSRARQFFIVLNLSVIIFIAVVLLLRRWSRRRSETE